LLFLLALIILFGTIVAFTFGVSEFASTTVGGFMGNGELGIIIPGESEFISVSSIWGPNIGYFLFILSTFILVLTFIYSFIKRKKNETNNKV
jgi:hypothetical protein